MTSKKCIQCDIEKNMTEFSPVKDTKADREPELCRCQSYRE